MSYGHTSSSLMSNNTLLPDIQYGINHLSYTALLQYVAFIENIYTLCK